MEWWIQNPRRKISERTKEKKKNSGTLIWLWKACIQAKLNFFDGSDIKVADSFCNLSNFNSLIHQILSFHVPSRIWPHTKLPTRERNITIYFIQLNFLSYFIIITNFLTINEELVEKKQTIVPQLRYSGSANLNLKISLTSYKPFS